MFELTIRLGNAAMETAEDVAAALRKVAERLEQGAMAGQIRDVNGNQVGRFTLEEEPC